ncbi:MAG: glutaredoxin 3 [Candidatus Marinimicrobia bacterium]|jgi:GrxC family glutaredoxin|nr:glutaredoxin 3 [Candidatus Neomarinimicrobiota bacterium]MBT7901214.1 glutaredoxin 3 [Candidatus Neomarinimicrobiota bacterium]
MIKIYTTSWCPYCNNAKRLLKEKSIEYEEINIEEKGISREELTEITGGRSVPQIVIDDKAIGGYDNLVALDQEGKL